MAPEDQQQRSVHDIGHLFLSNVCSLAANGMLRPQRKPPRTHSQIADASSAPAAPPDPAPPLTAPSGTSESTPAQPAPVSVPHSTLDSIDLTPEELDHVFGCNGRHPAAEAPASTAGSATVQPASMTADAPGQAPDVAPVTALLASHLGPRQLERAREYARHLAASGERVGLIDLGVSEFRLYCFDPAVEPGVDIDSRPSPVSGMCSPREIAEAVEELNVDIDRWLLLLPSLRTPEARTMIRDCATWTLLTTCDHDGIVSAYRVLKSALEGGGGEPLRVWEHVRISLATLDAAGDAEAARVQQKLTVVGRKFLGCALHAESPVRYATGVAEHPLMSCRVTRDNAQVAPAAHWAVVAQMLGRPSRCHGAAAEPARRAAVHEVPAAPTVPATEEPAISPVGRLPAEPEIRRTEPAGAPVIVEPAAAATGVDDPPITPKIAPAVAVAAECPIPGNAIANVAATDEDEDDVIDLSGDAGDVAGILAAVLRRREFGLAECPLSVPGCTSGRLAVGRDGGLMLVAAASQGLSELRSIGKAFQWMLENQSLIAMAMPQFALDMARTPTVLLLVDQADITGDLLRPMIRGEHLSVRAYRTLRWAGRRGLLLEAA